MDNESIYIRDITDIKFASFLYGVLLSSVIGPDSRSTAKYQYTFKRVIDMFEYIDSDIVENALKELADEGRIKILSNGEIVVGEYTKGYKGAPYFNQLKTTDDAEMFAYVKDVIWEELNHLGEICSRYVDIDNDKEFMEKLFSMALTKSITFPEIEILFELLERIQTGGYNYQKFTQKEIGMFQAMCKSYGNKIGLSILIETSVNWAEYFANEPTIGTICSKTFFAQAIPMLSKKLRREEETTSLKKF